MSGSGEAPPSSSVPGACLCGAVCFEIRLPTRFCVHCHCSMCRHNHGAAFVTWIGVPKAQLEISRGRELLSRHPSSEHGVRSFCSQCGSSLFCELDRDPDTVDIPLATIRGAIDRRPEAHVFYDDRVDWVSVDDDLPKLGSG